jgi:hypothetical protein
MQPGDFRRTPAVVLSTPFSFKSLLKAHTRREFSNLSFFRPKSRDARHERNAEIRVSRFRERARRCYERPQKSSLCGPTDLDHCVVGCSFPGKASAVHQLTSPVYAWQSSVRL